MPWAVEEMTALVDLVIAGTAGDIEGMRWQDGTLATEQDHRDLLALVGYTRRLRRRRNRVGQRRAFRLLRSLLSVEQNVWLNRLGCFQVTAASGQTYRLTPRFGHAERVEFHGSRWFARKAYCLHDEDDDGKLPPADVTIGHLLLLRADEPRFLATANENARDDCLWNGDYIRRIRAARREREMAGNEGDRSA